MADWRVPREWVGETVFIIGGGPSVANADLTVLRGRRIIVVNSSYQRAADFGLASDLLFFGDADWWPDHCLALASFAGTIVTTAALEHPRVLRLANSRPDRVGARPPLTRLALSEDPGAVPVRRTSMTGALNIAYLAGAGAIVTLGLDGKAAADGRTHHHAPHRKKPRPEQWDIQGRYDLAPVAAELAARGVSVINASPGSAHGMFPVMTLAEAIAAVDQTRVAA